MLHTPICDLLGIEHPIVQASLGPWTSVELSAAVSEAGAIGSLGTALAAPNEVGERIASMRELTDRPFIVNHTDRPFDEESWHLTLDARPAAVSFAIGHRGELIGQAHDRGIRFIQQVHSVEQAVAAAESGVDAIIAQGGEAGGFSGAISTMALVPQVVDAVAPVPVLAAGGIADGRGLAAALALGAAGVNMGTRFLASIEASIPDAWKQRIVAAGSDEAVKVTFAPAIFPPTSPRGYQTLPRALSTPFIEHWLANRDQLDRDARQVSEEMIAAVRAGGGEEHIPFTGESAGIVAEILPADEIVQRLVVEAESALGVARQASIN